jgi:protein-tyrosine phosphatase
LGDIFAASRVSTLKVDKIRAILTVTADTHLNYPKDLKHLIIEAKRTKFNMLKHFEKGIAFIEKHIKNTNVFVHCMAGVSRSGAMVVAYIMKTRNWTLTNALSFVQSKRTFVMPNEEFIE